jgi:protein-L-isoaspartate(D-aspartate) O-methyltransferase
MVERQLRQRGIHDERVLRAMAEVPRELFLPEDARRDAYRDGAVGIEEGQTMSQPWIVACMTALLELKGDETVLEVGTGSGYAAAVLSRCAAHVVTIERHASLSDRARATLAELRYTNVEVRVGDGTQGAPDRAPFGGISVTATAEDGPPQALLDQLAPGAALVGPVRDGGRELLMRFRDVPGAAATAEPIVPVRFVPLVGDE